MTQDDDWWLSRVSPWGVTRVTTGLGLSLPNNVTQMVGAVTATPTPTSHHTLHSQHSIQPRLVKTGDTSQSLAEYLRRLERELSTMLWSYLVRWALLSGQWGELSTPTTGSSHSSTSDDLYQTQSLTSPVLHVRRKLLSVQCPSALIFSSLKEVVDNLRAVKILEFCYDNNYDGKDKVVK